MHSNNNDDKTFKVSVYFAISMVALLTDCTGFYRGVNY